MRNSGSWIDSEALSRPYLTMAGRQLLVDRVGVLDATVRVLRAELGDDDRAEGLDAYLRAVAERDHLRSVLQEAVIVEEVVPDDPTLVAVGDTVAIALGNGVRESYVLVHTAEAGMDDHRISFDSPLGRALLFQPVGATVEVAVPAGTYSCTILSARRAADSVVRDGRA